LFFSFFSGIAVIIAKSVFSWLGNNSSFPLKKSAIAIILLKREISGCFSPAEGGGETKAISLYLLNCYKLAQI
jgi:hypothetical protein